MLSVSYILNTKVLSGGVEKPLHREGNTVQSLPLCPQLKANTGAYSLDFNPLTPVSTLVRFAFIFAEFRLITLKTAKEDIYFTLHDFFSYKYNFSKARIKELFTGLNIRK